MKFETETGHHARHPTVRYDQVFDGLLENRQTGLVLEDSPDFLAVQHAIGLCTRRAHGRPLAGIQGPELDAGAVDCFRHRPTERIDLTGQVSLTDAANRRVAAHLSQRGDVLRQQQRPRTGTRGGKACFRTGVAATDNDDVESIIRGHWSKIDQLLGAPF